MENSHPGPKPRTAQCYRLERSQLRDCAGEIIARYDDYDPATGRYVESDPLLQLNRLVSDELAFYIPILTVTPAWLHPYAYVRSQPTSDTDPRGVGPWGVLKCMWMFRKIDKYNKQCRGECFTGMEGEIKFMDKYESVSLSDALLKCTCSKAAQAARESSVQNGWPPVSPPESAVHLGLASNFPLESGAVS